MQILSNNPFSKRPVSGLLVAGVLTALVCQSNGDHNIYDASWYTHLPMPSPRSDLTATTVSNAIYLIGGCGATQGYVSSQFLVSTGIADGWPGYYCGSFKESGAVNVTTRFFPSSHEHEELADAPRARYRHAAAEVGGKIYIFGGTDDTDVSLQEVDVFDTATLSWSTLAASMEHAYNDLSAFVSEGIVYAVGGYDSSTYDAQNRIQALDTSTGIWTTVGNLQQGRGDAGVAVVDETLYVAGGFHHSDWTAPLNSVEHIKLKTLEPVASAVAPLAVARGDKAMVALHGLVHVIGGETKSAVDGSSEPLTDVEVLEPDEGLWRIGGHIPWHRFRFVAAAFDDSIFIFGGQGYLVGAYNGNGSYYPVVDTVTEYRETARGHTDSSDNDTTLGLAVLALVIAVVAVVLAVVAVLKAAVKHNQDSGMDACTPMRAGKSTKGAELAGVHVTA